MRDIKRRMCTSRLWQKRLWVLRWDNNRISTCISNKSPRTLSTWLMHGDVTFSKIAPVICPHTDLWIFLIATGNACCAMEIHWRKYKHYIFTVNAFVARVLLNLLTFFYFPKWCLTHYWRIFRMYMTVVQVEVYGFEAPEKTSKSRYRSAHTCGIENISPLTFHQIFFKTETVVLSS